MFNTFSNPTKLFINYHFLLQKYISTLISGFLQEYPIVGFYIDAWQYLNRLGRKKLNMEKMVRIDNMGGIEIPSILLDELELNKKDNLVIEVDNGVILLSKK